MTSAAATATAIAGLLAALLAILRYFNYKTKKDRMAAVGDAFAQVVRGLSSTDEVQRLASAILLRRFFDRESEFAVRGLVRRNVPYAKDAVNVIAAVLRTEPTGNVQKILADGLAYAPTLASVDLQRTNLRNAYLGAKGAERRGKGEHIPPSMERTDFFRADLTGVSFREAELVGAVFYNATVVDAVFTGTDLRGADFRGADLQGAKLDGARLAGARFGGAAHLPGGIEARLNEEARFAPKDVTPFEGASRAATTSSPVRLPTVFISTPSVADAACRAVGEIVTDALRAEGASIERVRRHDYSASSPLRLITSTMRGCWGVVILGLRQVQVSEARFRPGTLEQQEMKDLHLPTPWNQVEAGMAAALELPLLVITDCSPGGIFGLGSQGDDLRAIDLADDWDVLEVQNAVREWTRSLRAPT